MLQAAINFMVPMEEKPTYVIDAEKGTPEENMKYEPQTVPIANARILNPLPKLDIEGFEIVRHQTAVENLYDKASVEGRYYPEMQELVRRTTGAKLVVAFDWNARSSAVKGRDGGTVRKEVGDQQVYDAAQTQPPARLAHTDYTARSSADRIISVMGKETAADLLTRRFALINVWKPIRGPVRQAPLSMCDYRSVGDRDLVLADLVYPDRVGEVAMVTYNANQKWFYYPEMLADEALLFKCYDSDSDRASTVPHTAIDDPIFGSDAPPRESIEVRTMAFF